MISRAIEAGVPFAWFTADEAYGQAKWLQARLGERGVPCVMAIRRSDTLTMAEGERRADDLLAKISPPRPAGPEHAWSWSRWRRKRQYQARICHYQRRGYALT
jgi:hypothetical protein